MNFHVLTLFPQMVLDGTGHSILKRACDKGLIQINCVNIRDYAAGSFRQADDYPYGGGAGLVMMGEPVYKAYQSIGVPCRCVFMTPGGRPFNQRMAEDFSREDDLVILCGHYEGVDERVVEEIVTDEVSLGDFVLTGGEIAAMAVIDAVARLVPGVLGNGESSRNESFSNCRGLLEYPQYTRPPLLFGRAVPEVLTSGHHGLVEKWREEQSRLRTARKRPDLYYKG